MPRISRVFAGVVLPVAVVAAVGGCSSSESSASPKASTSASAAPTASVSVSASASASASAGGTGSKGDDAGGIHGRVDYTGSVSGGFDVTASVGCVIHAGRLLSVTAPDTNDASASMTPSFAVNMGAMDTAVLITPDNRTFLKVGAKGLSAAKHGGVWTVTASGTEVDPADASANSVTVNGHLTCTKTSGI